MRTRIIASALLIVAFSFQGFAQKIKTANEDLTYKFTRLPVQPLDEKLVTYSTNLATGGDYGKYGVSTAGYKSNLIISGLKQVPSGGHLLFEMTIDNPFITVNKVEKVTSKVKDKEGNEKTVITFEPRLSFDIPVKYQLVDYQNNVVFEKEFVDKDQTTTIASKGYKSEAEAKKALSANLTSGLKSKISEITGSISDYLSAQYGYTVKVGKDRVFSIKPKKHPEQAKFQKSIDQVKAAFSKVAPGADLSALETSIQPNIDYWIATEKGVPTGDKKVGELRYACLYNLTHIYTLLEKPEIAKTYLSRLTKLGDHKGEVKLLAATHKNVSEKLTKNPEKGLYYKFDVSAAQPPSSVAYDLGEGAKSSGPSTASIQVPSNCTMASGKVYYSGKEKDAAFILPNASVEGSPINLVPDKGFKIYMHNGSDFEEMSILLHLKPGDYFSFKDVKYVLEKADRGKYFDVKEVFYESDKVVGYSLNSMNKKPIFPKFRVKKKNSDSVWELKGLSEANWKTTLKAYFVDCPSIGSNVIDKVSMQDDTYLNQVCEYYTKSCK